MKSFLIIAAFVAIMLICGSIHSKKQKATQEAAQAEEQKKRRQEQEALRRAKIQQVVDLIEGLPAAKVGTEGSKGKQRDREDINETHFTNITTKTDLEKLQSFVAVDVETTGLAKTSGIVSIAAVRFEQFQPVETFYTLVNPEKTIPEAASAVNGISDEMVKDAPTAWQVMPSFQAFVGNEILVGHNLIFDLGFLYKYGFEIGGARKYDTYKLALNTVKKNETESYSLGDLCNYFGIPVANAHNSLYDAYMAGRLFESIAKDRTAIKIS